MRSRDFDQLVERAVAAIPRQFRDRMANLAIVVEAEPPHPGLLGLYHGRPLPMRSVNDPFAMPDTITIYQGPHERMAGDDEELQRIVNDTVWHEVAHYFGLEEDEVLRAERKRRISQRQALRKNQYNRERNL